MTDSTEDKHWIIQWWETEDSKTVKWLYGVAAFLWGWLILSSLDVIVELIWALILVALVGIVVFIISRWTVPWN